MRFRSVVLATLVPAVAFAAALHAQSSMADGLVPGDYLRVSGGVMSPINAQGSLREWDRGSTVNVAWENWQQGSNGVGSIGFAFAVDYGRLPFKESAFLSEFESVEGARATSAHATSDAQVFQISTMIRGRIPAPYIMPTLEFGFGIVNFQPGNIAYQTAGGAGTTSQRHRTGGAISIGGGLDKQVYDRIAIFGEAVYTYAFTSLGGQSIASAGGVCSSCDAFKNTATGVVRGGLRVRVSR
jgi:hypothetical protein